MAYDMTFTALLKSALAISALGLVAASACAADAGRSYYPSVGPDPKSPPPYSSGIMVGGTYYVAGTLGVDPATGKVPSDPEAEAKQANFDAIPKKAVVKSA